MSQHDPIPDSAAERQQLASRIRTECIRRGWALQELARRAGLSRTTLYHLQRGHTDRVRNQTLQKIAAALELPIEELLAADRHGEPQAARLMTVDDLSRRRFDAATNPAVTEVMRERPQLFAGWSQDDLDELYSLFGSGGSLTPRGVVHAAEAINRKRETIAKLQIVLETHLREEAIRAVDMFYRLVQQPPMPDPHRPPS